MTTSSTFAFNEIFEFGVVKLHSKHNFKCIKWHLELFHCFQSKQIYLIFANQRSVFKLTGKLFFFVHKMCSFKRLKMKAHNLGLQTLKKDFFNFLLL